jgi:tRNA-dihydrouridine synthase A
MTAEEIVPSHTFSVAPMMEVTDRHWRSFWRLISRRSKLYTEMVVDQTLLHQAPFQEKWLGHCEVERPLAVQLGGNDPEKVASAAEMCEMFGGYSEVSVVCTLLEYYSVKC